MEEVMHGNSFPRNPLMANFCAKTMPYRGLGSGIPRVLKEDSDVQFVDNKEGNQFTAIIKRPVMSEADNATTDVTVKTADKDKQQTIYELIKNNGSRDPLNEPLNEPLNTERIASLLNIPYSTTKRIIKELEQLGRIIRIGSKKTGYWEAIGFESRSGVE